MSSSDGSPTGPGAPPSGEDVPAADVDPADAQGVPVGDEVAAHVVVPVGTPAPARPLRWPSITDADEPPAPLRPEPAWRDAYDGHDGYDGYDDKGGYDEHDGYDETDETDENDEPLGPPEPTEQRLLRRLLGDAALALDATRRARILGWVFPLLVTAFGGFLRFWRLSTPHELVFDETYYVKQAYSMLVHGYEGSWGKDPNPNFNAGITTDLLSKPEYVVHPPVGKWMIALGMQVGGGVTSTFAWRLSVAVFGTLAILMLARIARRLFSSTALGTLAGLFLAVDGQAIVHSRISLLDPFVMFFALTAFGCLVLDREQARRRLAHRAAAILDSGGTLGWAPGLGVRWWRIAATVALGLTIGTKWSGIYFLAVFGVMSVAWDISARYLVGTRRWWLPGVLRDGAPAFFVMVPGALVTYLATWTGWFLSTDAWGRQWAVENPGQGQLWMPPALRSLWKYHLDMWHFHNTLTAEHPYAAHPLGWIVQWRPTSYYYPTEVSGLTGADAYAACGGAKCSQAITALGNPMIWWAAAAALLVAIYWFARYRDWRAFAVISGTLAGWVPWFAYAHRTIFTFYSVAFVPWVVLTLVYVLGLLVGAPGELPERTRRRSIFWVVMFSAVVVAVGLFFYPVWSAQVITWFQWHIRMWLPTWI